MSDTPNRLNRYNHISLMAEMLERITGDRCELVYGTRCKGWKIIRYDWSGKEVDTFGARSW